MAGTPIEILIKYMADARQARAETLGLAKAQDKLAESTAKASAAGKAGAGGTNSSTDSLNKNTAAVTRNTRGYKDQLDTTAQLMNQHKLLASAWKEGSSVVDKQYLSSIKGLQRGMSRFNEEAKKTILYNSKISTTLDDSSQSFLRFMMKGNLTVRTLENMSTKLINVGKNAQWTGRQMMVGITAPVVAIGAMSVKSALEVGKLDLSLKKLLQVNDGGNMVKTMKALDDQSKSVAVTLGSTRLEVKAMQGEFASMGFDGSFIKELTQITTEFQKLGQLDPAAASDMVRVLAQRNAAKGMSESSNAASVRDTIAKMNLIENKTALNMKDVASNFSEIFPIFDQFKTSAPQVIALLSGFKQQGVEVGEGANTLKLALTKLGPAIAHLGDGSKDNGARLKALKQSLEDVNKMTGMKFSLFDDNGQMRTGLDLLSQVGVAYAQIQKQGGKEAGTIRVDLMRSLFGVERANEGYAFLDSLAKSLDVQTAAGQDLAKAMQIANSQGAEATDSWMKQLNQYKNDPTVIIAGKIEKLKISFQELGAKLLPVAMKVLGFVDKIVSAFTNLPERTQNIILGLVGALAALGPITYISSQALLAMGTAFKGVLLPAKLFFGMLKVEPKEMLMGHEEMIDSFTDLRHSFDIDGDVKKYVSGVNGLLDSTKGTKVATESLTAAKEAQIFSTEAATAAINGEVVAQSRLNAIRQAGFRGSLAAAPGMIAGAGLSRTGTGNLAGTLDAMYPQKQRQAVVGRSDIDLASDLKDRIDRRHAKENERAQARALNDILKGDNLTVRNDVVPSAKAGEVGKRRTSTKRLQKQINAMGTVENMINEAEISATTAMDLSRLNAIQDDISKMERVKEQVTTFEDAWGFPVPVMPNAKITDAGERAKDFANRLDIFMQSVSDQTSWGGIGPDLPEAARIKRIKDAGPANVHGVFKNALEDAEAGKVNAERITKGIAKRTGRGATADTARELKDLMDIQAGETGRPQLMTGSRFDRIRQGLIDGPGAEAGKSYSEKFMDEIDSIFKDEDGGARTEAAINEQLRQIRAVADFRSKKGNNKDTPLPKEMENYRSSEFTSDIEDFIQKSRKSVGLGSEKLGKDELPKIQKELASLWTPYQKRDDEIVGVINALSDAGDAGRKEAFEIADRLKAHKAESGRLLDKITSDIGAGLRPAQADLDAFYSEMDNMEALKLKTKRSTDLLSGTRLVKRNALPKNIEGRVVDVNREKELADMKTRYADEFKTRYNDEVDKLLVGELSADDIKEIEEMAKRERSAARKRGESISAKKKAEIRESSEKLYRMSKLETKFQEKVGEQTINHPLDEKTLERIRKEAGAAAISRKNLRSKSAKLPTTASGVASRESSHINYALGAAEIDPASTMGRGMPVLDELYPDIGSESLGQRAYLDVIKASDIPKTPTKPKAEALKAMTQRQRTKAVVAYEKQLKLVEDAKAEIEQKAFAAKDAAMNMSMDEEKAHVKKWLSEAISSGDVHGYAQANGMPASIKEALGGALYGGMNQGGVGRGKAGFDSNNRLGFAGLLKQRFSDVNKEGKRTNNYDFEDDALFAVNSLAAKATEGDETAGKDAYNFKKQASQARRRAVGLTGTPGKYGAKEILPTQSLIKSEDSAEQAVKLNRVARRAGNDAVKEERNVREAMKALDEAKATRERIDRDLTDGLDRAYTDISFKDDDRQKLAKQASFSSADDASAYIQDMRKNIADNQKSIDAIAEHKTLRSKRQSLKKGVSSVDMSEGADADRKYGLIQEYENLLEYETDKNQPLEKRLAALVNRADDTYAESTKRVRKIATSAKRRGLSKFTGLDDVQQGLQDDIAAREKVLTGGNPAFASKIGKANSKIGKLEARQDQHMSGLRELEERHKAMGEVDAAKMAAVEQFAKEYESGKFVLSNKGKLDMVSRLERQFGNKADKEMDSDAKIQSLISKARGEASNSGQSYKRGILDKIVNEFESTRDTATSADREDILYRLQNVFGLDSDTSMSLENQIENVIGRADAQVTGMVDQKAYRQLGGIIKRKKQAIERTNSSLDEARGELTALRAERAKFYGKPEAAFLDFVDSEDEYQRSQDRVARMAASADRNITASDANIGLLENTLVKAEARRDSSSTLARRAKNRLKGGANNGDESPLEVMKKALTPAKGSDSDIDLTRLVGGLDQGTASAIHEMIVRQTTGSIQGIDGAVKTDLREAKRIIASHMPGLSDEMNTAYAEQGLLVSRAFGKNMQQAEQVFGKALINGRPVGITEQRNRVAAATAKARSGMDPSTMSTLGSTRFGAADSLSGSRRSTSGPDWMLDASNFDALMEDPKDDIDGSGALPSSGVNAAVEQRMLDELITGQFGAQTDRKGISEKLRAAREKFAIEERQAKIKVLEDILAAPTGTKGKDETRATLDRLLATPIDVSGQSLPKEVVKKIIDEAEVDVLTTEARIKEIDRALTEANDLESGEMGDLSRKQREEVKKKKKAWGKELATLKAKQREDFIAINDAMETRVSVTKNKTDADGNVTESKPVLYKDHREYIDSRLRSVENAHADTETLAKATKEESDAFKQELEDEYATLQDLEDIRVRNYNEQLDFDKRMAYDDAKADARKYNMRKRGRSLITGGKADMMGNEDVDSLTQMHFADIRNGSPKQQYDKSHVKNYRTALFNAGDKFDEEQADIFGPMLPPDMYNARRMERLGEIATPDAPRRGFINRLRHGRGVEAIGSGAESVGRRTFRESASKILGKTGDLVTGKAENLTGGILDKARWLSPLKPINMLAGGTKKVGDGLAGIASKGILMSPLNAMFPEMASGMASTVSAMGPLLPILLAVGAVVAVLAITWKKWSKYAKGGFDDVKAAGKALWKSVLDPIKGLFIKIFGQGEKGSTGMARGWRNLGETIGRVAGFIATLIKAITPVVKFIMEVLMTNLYIFIEFFKGVFALFTGDWEALGQAIQNIWTAVWNYVKQIAALAFQGIIEGVAFLVKGIINTLGKLGGIEIAGKKPFGGLESGAKKANHWIDGLTDKTADFFDSWSNEVDWSDIGAKDNGKDKNTGKKKRKDLEEGLNEGGAIEAPDMDTGKMDEAINKTNELVNAFRSRMSNIVQGWKEAALKAFDTWEENQIKAVQAKIDAIDDEVEAERKRDEDIAYLRAKEELREKRRADMIKYQSDRSLAIYEGRYDDAKQLDYENQQNADQSKKDEEDLEKDREKTLTQRMRDEKKKRIEIQKQELQETLDLKKEQLQRQLDLMTEYIPKNVAEAERMHNAILGTMMKFTNGYGSIGKAQAEQWGMGWADAMGQAKADIAFEAYWAGDAAMKYFAAALGVDITASDKNAPKGAGSDNGSKDPGTFRGGWNDKNEYHTGGHVGPANSNAHDIPATLQSGEYVIKRNAVQRLGTGFLDSVNNGEPEYPTFHTGGFVGATAKDARRIAGSAMKKAFHKGMDKWTKGKATMKIGAGSYSADNYKAAIQSAAGAMTPGAEGGPAAPGEFASGLNSEFVKRYQAWNKEMGGKFSIGSGFRTMAEQAVLYSKWLRRVPGQAKAAPPGSSMHNYGLAIDLSPSSTTSRERAAGSKYGLEWPMSYEPWHVQPVEAKKWRAVMQAGGAISSAIQNLTSGVGTGGLTLKGGLFGGGTGATSGGTTEATPAGPMARILKTIRTLESGGNYKAHSPYSTASGAYQFLNGTWGGYGGYPTAASAPPKIQDERAANDVRRFLSAYKNDLRAVPGNWYSPATFASGNWDGPMGNGNPMSMRQYISKWMGMYDSIKSYHKGGLVLPSMDVGGYVNTDGIAKVHAGETVLTKNITDALMGSGSVGGSTEVHLHFEGGFFGSDRELAKLQDKMERDIIPKMNRAKGLGNNTFSGATR